MLSLQEIKVWVLAPSLVTNDRNIDYYYDFSQSIEEYKKVFATLNIEWQWQPVTIKDYKTVIDDIANTVSSTHKTPVVFNLCDGDEINGTPGVSVIQYLKAKHKSLLIFLLLINLIYWFLRYTNPCLVVLLLD